MELSCFHKLLNLFLIFGIPNCISIAFCDNVHIDDFNGGSASFDTKQSENKSLDSSTNPDFQDMTISLRKCCPFGQLVNIDLENSEEIHCTQDTSERTLNSKMTDQEEHLLLYINEPFECDRNSNSKLSVLTSSMRARTLQRAQIQVNTSGVFTRASGNHKWVRGTVYNKLENVPQIICVDKLSGVNTMTPTPSSNEPVQVVVFCQPSGYYKGQEHYSERISISDTTFMMFAVFFLSLTVICHVLVWDTENIHGWTVTCYCFSMLVYHIMLASREIIRIQNGGSESSIVTKMSPASCVTYGIVVYFFFVAQFSWMVVLNFDMWSTIVSTAMPNIASQGKRRFVAYASFGFGTPAILVLISIFIEFHFDYFDDRVVRPLYGAFKCQLDETSFFYYGAIPNTVLFFIGVSFSCITVKFLIQHLIKTRKIHKGSPLKNKRHNDHRVEKLIGKMILLLAFSWAFEIAGMSWSLHDMNRYHVILFDIHNGIQSIGFFWIFTLKTEMVQKLQNKYRVFKLVFSWVKIGNARKGENEVTKDIMP